MALPGLTLRVYDRTRDASDAYPYEYVLRGDHSMSFHTVRLYGRSHRTAPRLFWLYTTRELEIWSLISCRTVDTIHLRKSHRRSQSGDPPDGDAIKEGHRRFVVLSVGIRRTECLKRQLLATFLRSAPSAERSSAVLALVSDRWP